MVSLPEKILYFVWSPPWHTIYSYILFDIFSDVYSDILTIWDSVWHFPWHFAWHSIWHSIRHWFWQSMGHSIWHFYLTSILAFYPTFDLIWYIIIYTYICWHSIWRIFWHFIWHFWQHCSWHSSWFSLAIAGPETGFLQAIFSGDIFKGGTLVNAFKFYMNNRSPENSIASSSSSVRMFVKTCQPRPNNQCAPICWSVGPVTKLPGANSWVEIPAKHSHPCQRSWTLGL